MWTPKEKQRTEVPDDTCVICGNGVGLEEKAMQCDMCESWEHVTCVKVPDRIDDVLRGGSLTKRINNLESKCTLISEQRLASAREREQALESLGKLCVDSKCEREELLAEINELRRTSGAPSKTDGKVPNFVREGTPSSLREQSENSSGSDNRSDDECSRTSKQHSDEGSLTLRRQSYTMQPHGFKELRSRIDKFSGASGEEDFEVWLEDFVEATNDCGWSDTQRARWFSWFISGPAKSTWQRTLKPTEKSSWESIVSVYKGQYGIHMDPRTTYQHCHELQYSHFTSVQGLMNAMRDYQRMAPRKLTDDILESIVWNKVPVELQQEVKEITDGSVQELLQKLLRAESTIAERKRRSQTSDISGRAPPQRRLETRSSDKETTGVRESIPRRTRSSTSTQGTAEATLRQTRCFNCSQKGHLAKDCTAPKKKNPTRRITDDLMEEDHPASDPWIGSVASEDHICDDVTDTKVPRRGPTYKAEVNVEGVKTRALLDHGAQVSIVRRQLLSHIRAKQGWTLEQCHAKNLPFASQPVGAGGEVLGTIAVVLLKVQVMNTDASRDVPCYVLDSSKPLWSGEVSDCDIVIGTNALSSLGFNITHPDGTTVVPSIVGKPPKILDQVGKTLPPVTPSSVNATHPKAETMQSNADTSQLQAEAPRSLTDTLEAGDGQFVSQPPEETPASLNLVLTQRCRLGPQQTNTVRVCVDGKEVTPSTNSGVIVPREKVLAVKQCDLLEGLWTGSLEFYVPITNWGSRPVVLEKGDTVAYIEEADLVATNDELWSEEGHTSIATISAESTRDCKEQLLSKLNIGNVGTPKEQKSLKELLCSMNEVFALTEHELGETSLVEHQINLKKDTVPFRTTPRRLPYALRTELEAELSKLMESGCIKSSTSPYASGSVKKMEV